jgi:hypothetical protein
MRPTIFVAVGLGLGFSAVAFGEGYAFSQPSDLRASGGRVAAILDRPKVAVVDPASTCAGSP